MSSKIDFAKRCQRVANTLADLRKDVEDVAAVFFNRGYNSGGGSTIVDADVAGLNFTAADLGDFINLSQQVTALLGGQVANQGAWGQIVNKVRADF